MHPSTILSIFGLASTVTAALLSKRACITAKDIIQLAPNTTTCADAAYPAECATADVAAPNIARSFMLFRIDSFGAQAALVALMLFESGEFKYNHNHFPAPGRPGQGTRNMQSPDFNQKYADWVAANGNDPDITTETVAAAKAQGPDAVLALVNVDRWSFASAAWFLSTQCDASVAEALATGGQSALESYLTDCVGTTVTDDRIAGWKTVVALGQW